ATNQIAQTGLSSLPPVIYYSEQLFRSVQTGDVIHAGQPVSGVPNDTSVGEISLKTGNNALNGEETV
ncbi:hypothetical protein, partial [Aeromonas caviae]|uniref:hypothetical protein n=1 Tax=Aeromonas caviae TaxID=648 RepID=UPI003977C562